MLWIWCLFFFSSRRRHTRYIGDWSSDVCSSDLARFKLYSIGVTKTQELEQGSYPNFVHGEVTPILTLRSCQLVFISSFLVRELNCVTFAKVFLGLPTSYAL